MGEDKMRNRFIKNENSEIDYYLSKIKWEINDRMIKD